MRLEQLRFFVAVANCHSINKASESLHISQQSLNFSIKKMEEELGYPLFSRDYQGVSLTPSGQLVYAVALEILTKEDYLHIALEELNKPQITAPLTGHLNILTSNSTLLLGKAIKDILNKHPQITFRVDEKSTPKMLSSLSSSKDALCIFAALKNTFPLNDELLQQCFWKHLFDSKTYALLTRSHPLSKYQSLSLKNILKYPLASYEISENNFNFLFDYLSKFGTPDVKLTTNNFEIFLDAILSGQVIGFIDKTTFTNNITLQTNLNITRIAIKESPITSIYALSPQGYYDQNKSIIDLFLNALTPYIR